MKIIENNASKLVLEDRPIVLTTCLWLMGLAAISAALTGATGSTGETLAMGACGIGTTLVAWHFFPFQRITFDRESGHMHRRIARVTNATEILLPFAKIRSAAGQGNWSEGTRMERIVLLTDEDPYPLEFGFFGTSRKAEIDAINTWLNAAREA